MTSKRIYLVEDEPIILQDLRGTLVDMGYEVVGTSLNAEHALGEIPNSDPDLLILDIDLGSGMNGIDMAHKLNKSSDYAFIFLTAFYDDDTVAKAGIAEPVAYLLKPWSEETLKVNIEMALHKTSHPSKDLNLAEPFFIKHNGSLVSLKPEDIQFIEAYDNYVFVHTSDQKYLINHTLKSLEEKLGSLSFIRVHKSFLVNINYIQSISEGSIYTSLKEIPIGKTYQSDLINRIQTL